MNSALTAKTAVCPARVGGSLEVVRTVPIRRETPRVLVNGPEVTCDTWEKLFMPAKNRLTAFCHSVTDLFRAVGRFGTGRVDEERLTRRDQHLEVYRFRVFR